MIKSSEPSKYGPTSDEVAAFMLKLRPFSCLRVQGLMTLAEFSIDAVRVGQAIFGARSLPDNGFWPSR